MENFKGKPSWASLGMQNGWLTGSIHLPCYPQGKIVTLLGLKTWSVVPRITVLVSVYNLTHK